MQDTQDQRTPPLADLGSLAPEVFDPHVGETFRVQNLSTESERTHTHPQPDLRVPGREDEIVEVRLIEVTRCLRLKELEGGFEHRPREPFSLLFECPAEKTLMNAVLQVHHDQLGTGDMLFSRVQMQIKHPNEIPTNHHYEVVFG